MNVTRLLPNRIASQITLLVIAAIAAFHIIVTTVLLLLPPPRDFVPPGVAAAVSLVRLIAVVPDRTRAEIASRAPAVGKSLRIDLLAPDVPVAAPSSQPDEKLLRSQLGPTIKLESASGLFGRPGRFVVRFDDGTGAAVELATDESDHAWSPFPGVLLATLAFLAINVAILSFWASRALTSPLARFARAAEDFSLDEKGVALAETGPEEIRIVAAALNRLRARIRSMVEDRTRMIAAVGHDLRTPITRLRLKAEFIDDEATRDPILRDLEQMNAMVHGALAYLRDGTGFSSAPTDLASLVQTVCNDFSDMGHNVTYLGPDHLVAAAQADALQRAITNLVENAVKHGDEVIVRLASDDGRVSISVSDDGPGIAADDKQSLMKPFARGDDARSLEGQTGFGLGLSIADAVAHAHGGKLDLLDNAPRGLIARIEIPA